MRFIESTTSQRRKIQSGKWEVWSHESAVEWKLGRWFPGSNLWLKGLKMLLRERKQREAHLLPIGLSTLEREQHFQMENQSGKSFCSLLHCCFSCFCSLVLHWRVRVANVLWENPTESSTGQDFGTNLTCERIDLTDDLASFSHLPVQEVFLLFKLVRLKLRFSFQ